MNALSLAVHSIPFHYQIQVITQEAPFFAILARVTLDSSSLSEEVRSLCWFFLFLLNGMTKNGR